MQEVQPKSIERELQSIEVRRSHRQTTLAKLAQMIEAARLQAATAAEELAAMEQLERMMLTADVRDIARRNALLESESPQPPAPTSIDAPQIAQLNDDCDLADARLDEAQVHPPDDIVPIAADLSDPVFEERHEPEQTWEDGDVIAQRNAQDSTQPQREFSDVY
jgi:hypothetical protein